MKTGKFYFPMLLISACADCSIKVKDRLDNDYRIEIVINSVSGSEITFKKKINGNKLEPLFDALVELRDETTIRPRIYLSKGRISISFLETITKSDIKYLNLRVAANDIKVDYDSAKTESFVPKPASGIITRFSGKSQSLCFTEEDIHQGETQTLEEYQKQNEEQRNKIDQTHFQPSLTFGIAYASSCLKKAKCTVTFRERDRITVINN